ncbi:hypothetical protein GCM10022255_031690 [Dactylosporangium darangshiense]|uniref:Protein DA1-like domain-containing protein n=1 Tax=Dactylosporangium darangshiense TaxID=579108 RepID=A0ABP8D7I8_9ACTN
MRGDVACVTHAVSAQCMFCANTHPEPAPRGWAPFAAGMMRCPRCLDGAVETQLDARRRLPVVRRQLAGIGLELPERVLVRVVSPQEAEATAGRPESGILLGVTEQVIGGPAGARTIEISVVSGMPPTYFGRAVAHEVGHAWLALRGRAPVGDVLEEGVCELFAYAWLKQHGSPLARALREQFASNPDPVYGAGFRAVYAAVRAHGIDTVLDGVLLTGRLP